MTDPIPLHVAEPQPQPEIVAFIRKALERAERGEFVAVAIAAVGADRTISSGYELGDAWALLVAASTVMTQDVTQARVPR